MEKLQVKLNLSDTAVRAILDDWGFEGYESIEAVLNDREYLEELGYDVRGVANELWIIIE